MPYEISRWVYGRRVARNGHVVWERNYYSVPVAHIGTKVDLRITDRMLESYRGTERLSSHLLLPAGSANEYRTNDADLPAGQRFQPWDAARVREWADRVEAASRLALAGPIRLPRYAHLVIQARTIRVNTPR